VFNNKDSFPTAVLLNPERLLFRASDPIAVLSLPVVLFSPALLPKNELSVPLPFIPPASLPTKQSVFLSEWIHIRSLLLLSRREINGLLLLWVLLALIIS